MQVVVVGAHMYVNVYIDHDHIGRAGPVKGRAPLRGAGINYRGGTRFTAHRSRSAE